MLGCGEAAPRRTRLDSGSRCSTCAVSGVVNLGPVVSVVVLSWSGFAGKSRLPSVGGPQGHGSGLLRFRVGRLATETATTRCYVCGIQFRSERVPTAESARTLRPVVRPPRSGAVTRRMPHPHPGGQRPDSRGPARQPRVTKPTMSALRRLDRSRSTRACSCPCDPSREHVKAYMGWNPYDGIGHRGRRTLLVRLRGLPMLGTLNRQSISKITALV